MARKIIIAGLIVVALGIAFTVIGGLSSHSASSTVDVASLDASVQRSANAALTGGVTVTATTCTDVSGPHYSCGLTLSSGATITRKILVADDGSWTTEG